MRATNKVTNQELQEIVNEIPIVILNDLSNYIYELRNENWKLNKTYKRYNTMYNKLKDRIDKAIEYIENNAEKTEQRLDFDEMKTYNVALLEIKDILKGVDKE